MNQTKRIEVAEAMLENSKQLFNEANEKDDPILFMVQGMVTGDQKDASEWGAAAASVLYLNDRINQLTKQVEAMVTLVGEKI